MINKDDIERLNGVMTTIQMEIATAPLGSNFMTEDVEAISRILAHLDQPYQWGDEVEFITSPLSHEVGYKYLCPSTLNTENSAIIENTRDATIRYARFEHIRPIKQTVQVELDKQVIEAARMLSEHEVLAKTAKFNGLTAVDICKAIASQEGEE